MLRHLIFCEVKKFRPNFSLSFLRLDCQNFVMIKKWSRIKYFDMILPMLLSFIFLFYFILDYSYFVFKVYTTRPVLRLSYFLSTSMYVCVPSGYLTFRTPLSNFCFHFLHTSNFVYFSIFLQLYYHCFYDF